MKRSVIMHGIAIALVGGFTLGLAGCESDEGELEKAGKEADKAVEEAKEKTDEAVEEAGEKLEEAGEKLKGLGGG